MIKLLSKKIVACICLVLTVFAVSTSVLATDYELPASLKHVTIDTLSVDVDFSEVPHDIPEQYGNFDYSKYLVFSSSQTDAENVFRVVFLPDGYDSFIILNAYNKYSSVEDHIVVIILAYNSVTNTFGGTLNGLTYENEVWTLYEYGHQWYYATFYTNSNCKLYYSTTGYYNSSGNSVSSIEPGTLIADFESLNQVSTDFNYKFKAETKNRLALTITDLDSSYKMIGFVDNPTTYEVGDVLSAGIDIGYQRITPGDSNDDYRYFGYMAPGETLTYYIVNDDYVVVDTGVIDDLSNGYFLYSYTNEKGIKYSFLKNGSFYWDDTLDFVWTDPNGYQYHNDQVITLSERYITVYEDVYSYTVTGTVYDENSNILAQADCTYIQEQGYLDFQFNRTYYDDYVIFGDVGKLLNNKIHSTYIINDIILSGLDSDGSYIDYSSYYVRWEIDTSIMATVDRFEVNNVSSSSFYGTFDGFVSNGLTGTLSFELDLSLVYSEYTPFNFMFKVYNSSGILVYTYILSSDDFIKKQIEFNDSTGSDKTYNVIESPNYSNNSTSLNFDNLVNWNEDDYKKLLSTDNFVWQFLLTVINLLPWWIYTPLAILLFGVVFISLLKFIRGG